MNKTQSETAKKSTATHRRMQHSSTLNRKYVKSPAARKASTSRNVVKASASEAGARAERAIQKAAEQKRREEKAAAIQRQATAKLQQKSGKKATIRSTKSTPKLTAKQRKDQAIAQALKSVAVVEQDHAVITDKSLQKPAPAAKKSPKKTKKVRSKHTRAERSGGNGKRFLIAFTCAAACVAALGALINANMPDISVRVAAMQTGIEASYPSYVPRDYSLANINSEEGKITMDFSGPNGDSFTLVEEKSSWDSNALLNNYVKPTWQEAYTVTHEQGITIYIAGSDAAWVNGGILYTLDASSNNLTKKQIRTIVTSL